MNSIDNYVMRIGKFWVSYNSLEFCLRLSLSYHHGEAQGVFNLKAGDTCAVNHLTNYDQFRELAKKFNDIALPENTFDAAEIVKLRDAISHGRAVAEQEGPPFVLMKFSPPSKDGKSVTVVFHEVLTAEYLDGVIKQVNVATRKVVKHIPGAVWATQSRSSDA